MAIPPAIIALIAQLNQQLDRIEQSSIDGIVIARGLLSRFPENYRIIELFAMLNNVLLFVEISRRRIQFTLDLISPPHVAAEIIEEAGEDLSELLGRTLENKILANRAIAILEDLS